MAGTIISGTYTSFISLDNPATQRPVTVTGKITNASGQGIVGNFNFAWTIDNQGTIEGNGTTNGFGIQLLDGGTVNNAAAGLLTGYNDGIRIERAPGTISNLGRIESTGIGSSGIYLAAGGQVTNGSASVTTALISGGGSHAIYVFAGTGTVTNFGTISATGGGRTLNLLDGGSVTNGSSRSTSALISNTGGATCLYIKYAAGTVTNFGTVGGASNGIFLASGGRVSNGGSGSTAGLITGTTGNAVVIAGTAGTVANFGTIREIGTVAAVALVAGGALTNGASGATSALITGYGNSVYVTNAPGTVTNFGTMLQTSGTLGSTVSFRDGGSVANFGKIESAGTNAAVYLLGGGAVTNGAPSATSATIGAAHNGITVRGGSASITNFGSIEGTNIGVYLQVGGNVANQAKGLISGSLYGVELRSGGGTVANLGSIVATGNPGHGVALLDGGDIVNGRSGSTAGLITGISDGVYLKQDGGMVTNFGTIKGAIGFNGSGDGDNTLINYGTVAGGAGVAVEMGNSVGTKLLVVEKGAVFAGLVEGGSRGEIEFAAAGLDNVGDVSGFGTIVLANGGANSLKLTDSNFNGVNTRRITVTGGNDGNTVNAGSVSGGGSATMIGGAGRDVFTGGSGQNVFEFSQETLTSSDKVVGGSGDDNELLMTSAGTIAADGVSAVEIYRLADGGANSLTLKNANFNGVPGGVITVYGGTGGNTIDGSKVTGAGDKLTIYAGAGADALTGGAGNDVFVFTAASLTAGDTVRGGGGNNELQMTTAGNVAAAKVSGVETYVLGDGGANTLALTAANFSGVASHAITVSDGNGGNTVSVAASVPGSDHIVVYAGAGVDKLTGGAGGDVFFAGGKTVMTGGAGANQFTFSASGSNTVADFAASAANTLMFLSGAGFSLPGAGATPQPLGGLFTTGAFTNSSQRFAYSGGKLFYSATGSSSTEKLVATLTGSPTLNPTHLLFMS